MSNSFSVYRAKVFFELVGSPDNTILSEDIFLIAKMIKFGFKVSCCAEVIAGNSSNYSLFENFRCYFDTGVFCSRESQILCSIFTCDCKYVEYKLGLYYQKVPISWCVRLMHKGYWNKHTNR